MEDRKEKKNEIEKGDDTNVNSDKNVNKDKHTNGDTHKESPKKQDKNDIDTGDYNQIQIYMFALILSGCALLSILYVLKKRLKKA